MPNNALKTLYSKFPDKDWYFYNLLNNKNITLDFIEKHEKLLEHIKYFSDNVNSDSEFVQKYYDKINRGKYKLDWRIAISDPVKYADFFNLYLEQDIPWSVICETPHIPWNYKKISSNKCITPKIINENLHLDWSYEAISMRDDITLDDVLNYPQIKWQYIYLGENKNIPLSFIESNPDYEWDWYNTYSKAGYDIDFVKRNIKYLIDFEIINRGKIPFSDISDNIDLPWDWRLLSCDKDLKLEFVLKHIDKGFHWDLLSRHEIATKENITNHPELPWQWENISLSHYIDLDFILRNLDKNFDWYELSRNPIITMVDVKNHPNLPWDYCGLSLNPNLTAQFVIDNIDKPWNFIGMSSNELDYSKYFRERVSNFGYIAKDEIVKIACHPTRAFVQTDNISNDRDHPMFTKWEACKVAAQNTRFPLPGRLAALPKKKTETNHLTTLYKNIDALREEAYNIVTNPNVSLDFTKGDYNLMDSIILYKDNPNFTLDDYARGFYRTEDGFIFMEGEITQSDFAKYPIALLHYKQAAELDCVTMEFVLANPQFYWDYDILIANPNITWDIICANPQIPWNKNLFVYNPNFSYDILVNNMDIFRPVLFDGYIPIRYIRENINLPWNWYNITANNDIDIEFILENAHRPLNWSYVSTCGNLTIKDIIDNPQLPWDYSTISFSYDITIDIAIKYKDKLNWIYISENKGITPSDIEKHIDLPWDWPNVCARKDIDMDFVIRNYKKVKNCFRSISSNPAITLDDVIKYPQYKWNYPSLSFNPNLTAKYVLDNPDKKWDYENIADNHFNRDEYFISDTYRMRQSKIRTDKIKEELIKITHHVTRSHLQTDDIRHEPMNLMYEEFYRCEREAQSGIMPIPKRLGALL